MEYEELKMDTISHSVQVKDRPVKLTRTEYAILKMLMRNPSQVVTKSVLLDRICEDTPDCVESSLKVHVSNLRRKLKNVTGKDYIEAVWGLDSSFGKLNHILTIGLTGFLTFFC